MLLRINKTFRDLQILLPVVEVKLDNINKYVNILVMKWEITYYSKSVQEQIDTWPVGIKAFYARVTERIKLYGPNL